jgi:hypothetical protein
LDSQLAGRQGERSKRFLGVLVTRPGAEVERPEHFLSFISEWS